MSVIDWAGAHSGNWTYASDWAGGVVPGIDDTAVIDASGGKYSIDITTAVTVGGLELECATATLKLSSSLASPDIALQAGILDLDAATLSGTVACTGGVLEIGVGVTSVLNDVTWQGTLDPTYLSPGGHKSYGTLVINNGLTLTGAGGVGPGSATFTGPVVFNDIATLDNATITLPYLDFTNSATLTLGTGLTLNADGVGSSGQTIINDGVVNSNIDGGTFINNGTLSASNIGAGAFTNNGTVYLTSYLTQLDSGSFTNNGAIIVNSGQGLILAQADLPTEGATGSIVLNGGALIYQAPFGETITTSQLLALYGAENITNTGANGFDVLTTNMYGQTASSTLNNAGATLDFGIGTTVGTLASPGGEIDGGTLVFSGAGPVCNNQSVWSLNDLTLQSAAPTLTLGNVYFVDVTLSGPTTLDVGGSGSGGLVNIMGGTLSGVGTLNVDGPGGIILTDVDITGVGDSGQIAIAVATGEVLQLTQQNTAGYSIDLTGGTLLFESIDNATINVDASAVASNFSAGTLGQGMQVNVAGGATLVLDGGNVNAGTITVSGGTLDVLLSGLTNTGSISVDDGTLILQGALTVASLSAISHPGSQEVVSGTLDLGGHIVTPGVGDVPLFTLGGGTIDDGTLKIARGQGLVCTGAASINTTLINNGSITTTGAGQYSPITVINGAISGLGTIAIGAAGDVYGRLDLGNTVATGQTLSFLGGSDILQFDNSTAYNGFAGTLAGFAVGDALAFPTSYNDSGVYGAAFFGKSIFIEFKDGHSIDLATTTALTGTLTEGAVNGIDSIIYTSNTLAIQDWSACGLESQFHNDPATGRCEFVRSLAGPDHIPVEWYLPHLPA
jgi:hypothetical protein